MLSASHNPMPDNGIKFLARGGHKLDDAIEVAIERRLREHVGRARPAPPSAGSRRTPTAVERVRRPPGAHDRPPAGRAHGRRRLRPRRRLRRRPAGAARTPAPTSSRSTPSPTASTSTTAAAPPTSSPLQAAVLEHGADVGFALDGDADRCLAVDHEGNVVDGDQILAVLALAMQRGRPAGQGHRGGHRDEQPRLRAGDAGRRHRRAPDQGRRPLRARGDAGRAATPSAASSPAT